MPDMMAHGSAGSTIAGVGPMQMTESNVMAGSMDLFTKPELEDSMLYYRETKYHPTSALDDFGPYNFHVPPESSFFIDTSSFRLEGQFKVVEVNAAGVETALAEGADVSIVNMAPAALFRTVEIDLNGIMVSFVSSPSAHYKSYL